LHSSRRRCTRPIFCSWSTHIPVPVHPLTSPTQHIFSTLATYGRLEATQLAQKCRLPLRQIRHGLAGLIQAQLIYHHTSSDQRTSYEANLRAAYDLIRNGKITHLALETLGEDAALVVAHILSVGQVTVKDLQRFWKQCRGDHNLQNGGSSLEHGEDHSNVTERADKQTQIRNIVWQGHNDLSNILKQLVKNGFVLRVRSAHFHTPADNYFNAQSHLLSGEDITTAKSRKGLEELGAKILEEVASRNDARISLTDVTYACSTGSKRPATDDGDSASRKKTKLTNGASSSSHNAPNCVAGHNPVAVCTLQVSSLPKLTFVRRLSQFASITTK
jgi:DNA-directed RNA polymerase III subunit RPC3